MACATSAMREAKNGDQITERIEKSTGIKIEIISGAKEAEIIFSAGIAGFEDVESTYFYIDVGGGSTELTIFSKGRKISSKSFPIGTVRQLKGKVKEVDWRELKEWLKDNLTDIKIDIAIGSGGNINKLLKLIPEKRKKDKYLSFEELKSIYGDLSILTEEERMVEYGLNQDRADVIVPAAKVFLTLMHWANIDEIAVPKFGLADGLVRKLAEENY
jgi:exopolyphosphatase/guanosine-5'-triphosphate,3'-diphosphate pyrophosphatase